VAKAEITTVDGFRVKVEGTPEEVAKILEQARRGVRPARSHKATKGSKEATQREGLPALLDALREEKFFKKKCLLGDISARLSELGHHYSGTTLGKQLLREVRGKRLRRLKEGGKWVYVQ
jgi:hypothetical protein